MQIACALRIAGALPSDAPSYHEADSEMDPRGRFRAPRCAINRFLAPPERAARAGATRHAALAAIVQGACRRTRAADGTASGLTRRERGPFLDWVIPVLFCFGWYRQVLKNGAETSTWTSIDAVANRPVLGSWVAKW